MNNGKVILVGAGPGDPGLLTVKGRGALESAEVLVYDYLANPELLALVPADCEKLYVGKKAGAHSTSQEDINALLVEKAGAGSLVVRLKGGDPFVFGRGGEEALALREAGISFEIVPGVTAGIAAAAYAGIPFTHRGLAVSAGFVTGHEMDGDSRIDWEGVARLDTAVFYMGVGNLGRIVSELTSRGKDPSTPVALVRWGTRPDQETVTGTLATIEDAVKAAELKPPAVIIVGAVAALRGQLRWFEDRPLFGRQIVVTRSRSQASSLSAALRKLGAAVTELPTIDIRPREDLSALDTAMAGLGDYGWLAFTSANGAEIFFRRLRDLGKDARALAGLKVAVMGPGTAAVCREAGVEADLVPQRFTSDGLVDAFRDVGDLERVRVLIPTSSIARDVFPTGLRDLGAEPEVVPVYDSVRPEYSAEDIAAVFEPNPDAVTFTSSSTVSHLAEILEGVGRAPLLRELTAASIGPITSSTARELRMNIALEANQHDIPGLVEALTSYFKE